MHAAEEEGAEGKREWDANPHRRALYDIMSCMRDVRKRSELTDAMFEPLRQAVTALQGVGVALPDGVLRQVGGVEAASSMWGCPVSVCMIPAVPGMWRAAGHAVGHTPVWGCDGEKLRAGPWPWPCSPALHLNAPSTLPLCSWRRPRCAGRASRRRPSTAARRWPRYSRPRRWTCGARATRSMSVWRSTASERGCRGLARSKVNMRVKGAGLTAADSPTGLERSRPVTNGSHLHPSASRFFLKRAPFAVQGGGILKVEHIRPAYQVTPRAMCSGFADL